MHIEDQVFRLADGFYCLVSGKQFGPWPMKGYAEAGMATEQRRAAKRATSKPNVGL